MEKKTIGTFLCALRKANGLTQRQLAEKLNVSDKAISRWERDECAPDLSLIPVLAEIYGITSDEILRGQRSNPDEAPHSTDSRKAEKQRKHLLSSTKSRFHIRSVISAAIAVIGLIVIIICNTELSEANIAFLLGSTFFTVTIVNQVISAVTALAAIQDDEWADISLTSGKGSILMLTELIISSVCIMLAAILPLAGKSHESVSLFACISSGLPYILIAAVACFIICLIINLITFRQLRTGKHCLRMICSGTLSLILIGLLIGQVFLNCSLLDNRHLYAPCDEFKTLRSFKHYMEMEFAPDGSQMTLDCSTADGWSYLTYPGNERINLKYSDVNKQLVDASPNDNFEGDHFTAEYGYEFEHWNRNVVYYELSNTEEIVPIYTFTTEQLEAADQIALGRLFQYSILYIIPIALTTAVYLILRRKYA